MNFYNKILEKAILPIGDILNGSSFIKNLRKWRRIQRLSEGELFELSRRNLAEMMIHATTRIPHYKNLETLPNAEAPEQWLAQFPILKKKDVRAGLNSFILPDSKDLIAYESSGSSGIQGRVYMDKLEQSTIRSIQVLWWEWARYRLGNSVMQTGITPDRGFLKSIKDRVLRTHYVSAFDHSDEEIARNVELLSHGSIRHLCGYASSLFLIAKAFAQRKSEIQLESIISWGDKMFPHYRSAIEAAFKTKVFDTYACNEGLMIAAQHDLPYYYIMSPHVYVEIVDDQGKQVRDGELGHVVVTRLDNYSMPLIRYSNGDLAVKLPRDQYPEERAFRFPLLERIIGRDTDIVKTRSGKYLIVHFFTGIFEFYPSIRQFRVIQRDLDSITIEYIPENGFDSSVLSKITNEIEGHLGEHFSVAYKPVNYIPATASGKPQIIKSELS